MSGTRVEQHLRAAGRRPRQGRGLVLAAAGLGLLAIGLGTGEPLWRIGGPPELISPRSYTGDLLVVAFGVLAVAPLVIRAIRGRARGRGVAEDEPEVPAIRPPWWLRIAAFGVVALTVLIVLLLVRLLPGSGGPAQQPQPALPRPRPGAAAAADRTGPQVHWWGIVALALVLLGGAAIAWRLRSRPPLERSARELDENAELVEALDLSLEELEDDPDPRHAVIRAYARMERALGSYGLARAPSETPLEYLARALGSLNVGRPAIARLTALHERAKFSPHEVDGSMKTEAIAALTSLRDDLAGAPA